MSVPEPIDFALARFVRLEQQIGQAEEGGLRARWEFGRDLLAKRDGKGRLPNGYLALVEEETNGNRVELKRRMQFAQVFSTEQELAHAVSQFRSWHAIVNHALPAANRDGPERREPDALPPPEPGTFRAIVADPPWRYDNKATRGAAEDHYPTLSIADLCGLEPWGSPVADLAAEESHLYLWTTNGLLREAFEVVEAWGFAYKTCLTWVKPQIGLGNYFRSATEHVLFGVRGGIRTLEAVRATPNWFEARRAQHSRKPDVFTDLVEKASPGPYLELFARRRRLSEAWSYWGDQA